MSYSVQFAPLFSPFILAAAAILAALPLLAAIILRRRGSICRLLACAFFALALANPVMLAEQREPLPSIVAIVADNSQSQNFGTRMADTRQALAAVQRELRRYPQFTPRIIEAARQSADSDKAENTETRLFTPLRQALADVPPARIGGVIFLTDGQIADIPPAHNGETAAALNAALGFSAPVNALISGRPHDYDRRIHFVKAPRFGLAGKKLQLSFMADDEGAAMPARQQARAEIFVNGESQGSYNAPSGKEITAEIALPRIGSNIIEVKTPPLHGELTAMNNRAALIIDGVRENLKVLLVSGEPHNGLRAWRDLLKSDTGVDLVHFTILRPPEKADNTPINKLSLIVFPTTELFVNRLKDFDLVIFDRYQNYNVLPLLYYEYMARYVENGGALLVAAGPEYAGGNSLALTPLARILPARPTGNIFEKPFLPRLTEAGRRHPVTRDLPGGSQEPPQWGPWLRQIEAEPDADSTVLLEGVNKTPLMLLAHKGKGRVAMLLSDEGWLWERGYKGGGPYALLYRRMAHWLMKEPELEAESLTASAQGHKIFITRRTMAGEGAGDEPGGGTKPAAAKSAKAHATSAKAAKASPIGVFRITLPSGKTETVMPQKQAAGLYTAQLTSPETGLLRIENGGKTALVHAGAANIPEFADIIATPAKLAPMAAATGGQISFMHEQGGNPDTVHIGGIKAVADARALRDRGTDNFIVQSGSETKLTARRRLPLSANIWALALGLGLLALCWWRETRS